VNQQTTVDKAVKVSARKRRGGQAYLSLEVSCNCEPWRLARAVCSAQSDGVEIEVVYLKALSWERRLLPRIMGTAVAAGADTLVLDGVSKAEQAALLEEVKRRCPVVWHVPVAARSARQRLLTALLPSSGQERGQPEPLPLILSEAPS
jgi:hypothetical protein